MQKKDLVIGVPKEIYEGCRCVSLVPEMVKSFVKNNHKVLVQKDAGIKAFYTNDAYREAGAELMDGAGEIS